MQRTRKFGHGKNLRALTGALARAAAALVVVVTLGVVLAQPANAASKKLSDKAVKYLMSLTWAIMPDKIKGEGGKQVPIDKSKREDAQVPLDDARRVIMVARRSAHAQICKMPKLQKSNYRTMMKLEIDSKKWSRKQIVYLNQLHLFTVMWLTGNVSISEDDNKKAEAEAKKKVPKCSDEQQAKVKAQIEKYLAANPLPEKEAKKTEKTAKKAK